MMTSNSVISERVESLRRWMRREELYAFVIPTGDPHGSEYLPDHWKVREWITGFTGSAGMAVVTLDEAALWTDSRYFLQAEEQLSGTPFQLMRMGEVGVPSPESWLSERVDDQDVGYCGSMMDQTTYESFNNELGEQFSLILDDPFDQLWKNRPALPTGEVVLHPLKYAKYSSSQKLEEIWLLLSSTAFIDGYLFNNLADIAWILNLRGNDIEYNPLILSYLYVEKKRAVWYVDEHRLSSEVKRYLNKMGVNVQPYSAWKKVVSSYTNDRPKHVIGLPEEINCEVLALAENYTIIPSPASVMRANKNTAEIAGFRLAMEADGVAMVRFLRWLDEHVATDHLSEVDVDRKLTALRAEHPDFCSLSFATIAGYAANGAIVHYEAAPETAAILQPNGLLLLDSGAHYTFGTTDITRTIALGEITEEERKVYTLVLKGHIALSKMCFPYGTTGLQLDTAARYAMWQEGYDFGHGTGHGVGSRLVVHEGPHQIRKNVRDATLLPILPHLLVTNEPGIYVPGKFGVRIENILLVNEAEDTDFGSFLSFETLTLCPYDLRPVNVEMLTTEEKAWINAYHEMVRQRLMPLLEDEADRIWLEQATRHL